MASDENVSEFVEVLATAVQADNSMTMGQTEFVDTGNCSLNGTMYRMDNLQVLIAGEEEGQEESNEN